MLCWSATPSPSTPPGNCSPHILQDPELRAKVQIIVERKDVIYRLDVNQLDLA